MSDEVNRHAAGVQSSKEENHEVHDISECSHEQFDVEGGLIKQSEPLEEFNAYHQNDYRGSNPHVFIHFFCDFSEL